MRYSYSSRILKNEGIAYDADSVHIPIYVCCFAGSYKYVETFSVVSSATDYSVQIKILIGIFISERE